MSKGFVHDSHLHLCSGPLAIVLNVTVVLSYVPLRTDETYDHEQWKRGKGCIKDINIEAGSIMRVMLDRTSPHDICRL